MASDTDANLRQNLIKIMKLDLRNGCHKAHRN